MPLLGIESEFVNVAENKVTALGQSGIQQQQTVTGIKKIRWRTFTANMPEFAVDLKRRQIFFTWLNRTHFKTSCTSLRRQDKLSCTAGLKKSCIITRC